MAELVHEGLQRHAVLQRVGDRLRERVGEARDRRAFLRHHEEDFARLSILEEADRDVALVALDVELVRDRVPLVRQLAADRLRDELRRRLRRKLGRRLVPRRVERLRALAAVAVDGDRLRAQLPRLDVGLR